MKKIILFFIVFPLIYINFFSEKAQFDREVKRLCAIDGGIMVYETVKLPTSRFNEYGQIRIPTKDNIKPEDEYYFERTTHYEKKGNPEMWRSHTKVYRRSDEKLLGEAVSYARRGGDIPAPWHPSSFRCPEKAGFNDLNKQIFIKEQRENL